MSGFAFPSLPIRDEGNLVIAADRTADNIVAPSAGSQKKHPINRFGKVFPYTSEIARN
jgi:hypothetical protein